MRSTARLEWFEMIEDREREESPRTQNPRSQSDWRRGDEVTRKRPQTKIGLGVMKRTRGVEFEIEEWKQKQKRVMQTTAWTRLKQKVSVNFLKVNAGRGQRRGRYRIPQSKGRTKKMKVKQMTGRSHTLSLRRKVKTSDWWWWFYTK